MNPVLILENLLKGRMFLEKNGSCLDSREPLHGDCLLLRMHPVLILEKLLKRIVCYEAWILSWFLRTCWREMFFEKHGSCLDSWKVLKVHKHEIFFWLFCRNRILMVPRACNTRFLKILFGRDIRLLNISVHAQHAMKSVPSMLSMRWN